MASAFHLKCMCKEVTVYFTKFIAYGNLQMLMYFRLPLNRFQLVIWYSWFMASGRDWRKLILLMMLLIFAVSLLT